MKHFVGELRKGSKVEVLKIIDPMALEMAYNIVDIIISRLFDDFRINRGHMDKNKDMKFVKKYQKIHRNISVLKNAKRFIEKEYAYESSIQNQTDITDSMEMRKNIMDLKLKDVYSVAEQLIIENKLSPAIRFPMSWTWFLN